MNDDLKKIIESRHETPHDVLGPHPVAKGTDTLIFRTFIPYAATASLCIKRPLNKVLEMNIVHPDGLFETEVSIPSSKALAYHYQITDADQQTIPVQDAYQFQPHIITSADAASFANGEHCSLFNHFGAHPDTLNSISGVCFCVWAPNAQRVSVVGNFNRWDGRCHPMCKIDVSGIWELFIPDANIGDYYKFEIKSRSGEVFLKTDPYAFQVEDSPEAPGIIFALDTAHTWNDLDWNRNKQKLTRQPCSVYKLDTDINQNADLTIDLAVINKKGYSHIDISALWPADTELVSYFSSSPGMNTAEQLMAFVDRCHQQGLGVISAGISSHSNIALNNLACFDGGPMYEEHNQQDKHMFCFDTANPCVQSFFLSHALFWMEKFHIDGFRLDLGGSIIYRRLTQELTTKYMNTLLLADEPDNQSPLSDDQINRLFHGPVDNPFSILGRHTAENTASIRAVIPNALQAYVYFPDRPGIVYVMQKLNAAGLWQAMIPIEVIDTAYKIHVVEEHGFQYDCFDAYAFEYTHIHADDRKLFAEGNHYRIYEKLGAHLCNVQGIAGVNFAVWAPNAAAVSIVGPFNQWDGRRHLMKRHLDFGIWELFIPGLDDGELYKFSIRTQRETSLLKSDPFAFYMETAPDTASIVHSTHHNYQWRDAEWLHKRRLVNLWQSPISIYEVHLSSWMRGEQNSHLSYEELAQRLIPYVKKLGFTHIEILPIAEHPYEPSWGYQVSNFYAPTSRLGTPEQLMAFIDQCHNNDIGVILDWVAGHFPKDAHALAQFDGTHLFEHADPRQGEHKDWGTLIFNYGRHEVENFLIANALFWLELYHFDGLRVDAVASMLYLDYSRNQGEWIPNIHGGNENIEAIEFLKHTNSAVHAKFPGVLMIAEESTSWPGVSQPTDLGGLGFGFKWNMGWMHDVLSYMQTPPEQRPNRHQQLVFVFHYAFEENFVLSLSHDEVVHLKGSLLNKMPGTEWDKFANLRLLFSFMYAHPGKKLNFMGAEFAQVEEWNESKALQWQLLEQTSHQSLQLFFQTLNQFYREQPALYEKDCRSVGFDWIDAGNHEQSIIAFVRKAKEPRNALIVVLNFSAVSRFDFRLGVPFPVVYTEVLNSNDVKFGGVGRTKPGKTYAMSETPWHGQEFSLQLNLPALSTIILKPATPHMHNNPSPA